MYIYCTAAVLIPILYNLTNSRNANIDSTVYTKQFFSQSVGHSKGTHSVFLYFQAPFLSFNPIWAPYCQTKNDLSLVWEIIQKSITVNQNEELPLIPKSMDDL